MKGGAVVEFLNNDIFAEEESETYKELKKRIGSDEKVSAIISFRTEEGKSSSEKQRESFKNFLNNTKIMYKGKEITITEENYKNYTITQKQSGGKGNEKWEGFLFVSIRGGQQDTIETHHDKKMTIFNPACEYASEDVSLDIDLTLLYFLMKSIQFDTLNNKEKVKYAQIMSKLKNELSKINYQKENQEINLYEYCSNHPSVKIHEGELTDPIQLKRIDIENFKINTNTPESIDLTHNEAVNLEKYYWDNQRKTILSPARPTNIFWSYHLSNMMQQNFTLKEYIEQEEKIYKKRQKIKEIF